ncbi:nucleoporin NUP145-like isoform X2 [Anopheles albimanus]|uniref:nucleoporin NUP145-like isoform X2 n=1 Tax=Anopheles albimanus TaxID=7167 RepID=UPI0016415E2E|nr:nucleoporin NUP145-like isoform X2 [Anopheles albimanus]
MKVWWFARIFSTTVADLDRDATTSTSIYVEVTLNGNQWPLSCFGPFKDRNSIPNFIEDQSFEEIRMMYLEAKMQNNIPAHQMQLAQMINDAKGKLQRLATMSRDILGTLVELYNQQEPSTKPTAGGNPFASIGSFGGTTGGTATSSIFGTASSGGTFGSNPATGGSLFGGAFSGQAAQSTGSIFGGSSAAPSANPFAAATQQQPVAGGSIFGLAQTTQQPSNSVFGAPPVLGSGIGLFGNVQQSAPTTGNIFASVVQPAAPTGASIFNQTPAQQPAPLFGQQQPQGDMFASVGFSSAQPLAGGSLFNPVPFGSAPAPTPFGQAAVPTNATSQSIFTPAPTAAPTPFGTGSVGGAVFGGAAPAPVLQSATMYSKLEEIPADALAAFNADQFQLGRIPTIPPPKELCH